MNGGLLRQTTLVLLILAAGLASVMFAVKYEVQGLEEELKRLNREIATEERSIHVLRAEWNHLRNPDRLRQLSQRYLSLQPIAPDQLGSFSSLPMRPLPEEEEDGDDIDLLRLPIRRSSVESTGR